jgi:DNA primase small subunit
MSAGETDEPVTCDVKRLIRLPGSLHGKTGLKVEKINLDGLKEFDPLRDAVVLSEEEVDVDIGQDFEISMKDETFKLEQGKQKVPTYLATILIGRRIANVI